MADKDKSFWATLPGVFTGLATLITALGGFITIFYQMRITPSSSPPKVLSKEEGKRALSSRRHRLDAPGDAPSRNSSDFERTNVNARDLRVPQIAGVWMVHVTPSI